MAGNLVELNKKAIEGSLTHLDFLELFTRGEIQYKEESRIKRRLQQAKFPKLRRLADFNFTVTKLQIDKRLIFELASCRYLKEAKNIIFWKKRPEFLWMCAVIWASAICTYFLFWRIIAIHYLQKISYIFFNVFASLLN